MAVVQLRLATRQRAPAQSHRPVHRLTLADRARQEPRRDSLHPHLAFDRRARGGLPGQLHLVAARLASGPLAQQQRERAWIAVDERGAKLQGNRSRCARARNRPTPAARLRGDGGARQKSLLGGGAQALGPFLRGDHPQERHGAPALREQTCRRGVRGRLRR